MEKKDSLTSWNGLVNLPRVYGRTIYTTRRAQAVNELVVPVTG